MIYCNLKGGMANMLFQIAAAKSLAIDNNSECNFPNLITHLNYLNGDNTHNPNLKHSSEYLLLLRNLKTKPCSNNTQYFLYPFEYTETKPITNDVLIDGFFQSEKYFVHNREEILKFINFDFIKKDYIDSEYNFLRTKRCTSIHVRRGDYLNFPQHHPIQTLEYYLKGIELLKNKTDLFVIFSDDIEWCKENLKLKNCVYIVDEKDYIELYLMSLCKHNIISNSSFSWWGAWLNKNKKKKVIGPNIWFGPAITHNTSDIIPETWIKI